MDKDGLFSLALRFAADRHEGQMYGDRPYIHHPIAVSCAMRRNGLPLHLVTAGLLHDVLEDTSTTFKELLVTFGEEISIPVLQVTKMDGETEDEYFSSMGEGALWLKLFDTISNARGLSRLQETSPDRACKLAERYRRYLRTEIDLIESVTGQEIGLNYEEAYFIYAFLEGMA